MQGEMKVVKSTEVSKKLIDSNTNEITFKVILEQSLVDDQQTAAFNKQSLSISTGSPGKVSLAANIKRKCLLADNFGKLNKINIFSFLGHFGSTFWACLMAN